MSRAMPELRSSSARASSSICSRFAVSQSTNMANTRQATGSTPDGMRYSPNCTETDAGPSRLASAARKIVTSAPPMEIQNRCDRESMERTIAWAGMDSAWVPA